MNRPSSRDNSEFWGLISFSIGMGIIVGVVSPLRVTGGILGFIGGFLMAAGLSSIINARREARTR